MENLPVASMFFFFPGDPAHPGPAPATPEDLEEGRLKGSGGAGNSWFFAPKYLGKL